MARPGGKKPPSLWPKEHGAYAEMAFPLVTGLALGRPTLVATLLVAACVCAFVVHEVVLVLAGIRGRRTKDELGAAAWRNLLVLGGFAAAAAIGAAAMASETTRRALVVPAGLAVAVVPLVLARQEKTAVGEAVVASAFSSALVPVAMASGVELRTAITAAVLWLIVFLLGTFMVRLTLERARKEAGPMRVVSPLAAVATLAAVGSSLTRFGWAPLAVVPTAIAGLVLWLRPVSAKQLRTVGWSLVGGNAFAFVAIVATLRG